MKTTRTFGNTCTSWGSTCTYWCVAEVKEIIEGGARNPQEWGDHPYDLYDAEQELQNYQLDHPDKRRRLIEIYVQCHNKKYKKTITIPENKIFIKVQDVEFILDEMKSVGIDITNIRKYSDDELHNLLG